MFYFLAAFALLLILSSATAPKPQSKPPAGLNEIQAPTAEEGREIPVLFGCRDIHGANTVWYGDLRTVAIKAKQGKK